MIFSYRSADEAHGVTHVNNSGIELPDSSIVLGDVSKTELEEVLYSAGIEISASCDIMGFSGSFSLNYQLLIDQVYLIQLIQGEYSLYSSIRYV